MLSKETLERYRQMTPGERLSLTLWMLRQHAPALLCGPPDVVARKFVLLRRENDARNKNILEGLARAERKPD